jgi:hypothetical protein
MHARRGPQTQQVVLWAPFRPIAHAASCTYLGRGLLHTPSPLLRTCPGVQLSEEVEVIASKVAAILMPKFETQMAELANKISPRLTPEQAEKVEKAMFLIFTEVR